MNVGRHRLPPLSVLQDPGNADLFEGLFQEYFVSAHECVEARQESFSRGCFDRILNEYPQVRDALKDIRVASERRASEHLQRRFVGEVENGCSDKPAGRRNLRWRLALYAFLHDKEKFRDALAVNEIWGYPAREAQEWLRFGNGFQTRDQILAERQVFEERVTRALDQGQAEDIEFQWLAEEDEIGVCVSRRGRGRGHDDQDPASRERWTNRRTGTLSYDPHRRLLRIRTEEPFRLHMLLDGLPTLARTDRDVEMPLPAGEIVDLSKVTDESFQLAHYFDADIENVSIRELRLEQASHGDPNREELSPWSMTINDNLDALHRLKLNAPRLHGARIGHLKLIMEMKDGGNIVVTLEPPRRVLISNKDRFDKVRDFLRRNGFTRNAPA